MVVAVNMVEDMLLMLTAQIAEDVYQKIKQLKNL
jgi:hypothetical protein